MTKKKQPETAAKKQYDNYVVGIGASAGGLEALQKLLSALPANTGFPYIIVQHLSPDYKSLLGEILAKYTEMPVMQVEDGIEVKPNCVYVIQPGKNMRISGGKLLLSAQKERELNLPIDMFFRSLAEEAGAHAIAIVLSGTGSDGTNGIKDIKENDGMIIVQDIDSSKFDGMPRSAIRTGLVDAQISPEEIALELQHISMAADRRESTLRDEKEIDEELMKKVYIILKKVSNINFTHYKQTTVIRRIERRMMLMRKETLSDYVAFLYESPEEVRTLAKEVLIGVTSFFRDPDFFHILKEKAIQNILVHSVQEEPIRVWVAGCSTGEEAYSIAILFCEMMETLKLKRTVKIFATDLDVESITFAGKGVYNDNIVDAVSPARLSRFFTRRNNTYIVNREIRKMIVFSPHNVFQDPPFGRLDLISCRNMLIYFQPVLQNDLFAIFHTSLKDGGYLFLGKSEAIGAFTDAFPVVDAAAKLFSHCSSVQIPGAKAIPYLQTNYLDEDFPSEPDVSYTNHLGPNEIGRRETDEIDNTLLEQFMPACLVVNEKNELVHTYGESSNYVHLPMGRFSNSLYELLTDALKIPVSTLLKTSRETKKKVRYDDIHFMGEREEGVINLTAMPIGKSGGGGEDFYALVFGQAAPKGDDTQGIPYNIDRVASQRITDLEQDLSGVQNKLDRSVAEQECVNEELQAANEELLTANEELQSSNEELQSVNEELYTVNSEYQLKLTELADLNDDIANFLSSTLIGIIFVDNKLNIRRYTDYVTAEFSVMDHDIGRSLKFISYHFPTVDISEICDNVLKTLVPDEREITTSKNKVFFMRVAPYRSTENKILGCVITLVDTTSQKQGLAKLQKTEERLSMVQQASEAKSDYLSYVSREINAPMSELIKLSAKAKQQKDPKDMSDSLERIAQTVDYMSDIVEDMQETTRIETQSAHWTEEPFELRDVAESVKRTIAPRAQKAQLEFSVDIAKDFSPKYVGNYDALRQILVSYLSQSVRRAPKGGRIELRVFEGVKGGERADVCFLISEAADSNVDYVPERFRPFTRSEYDWGNADVGFGLGTIAANNLIKSMDGSIEIENAGGRGSVLVIRLSLRRYDEADYANTGASANPHELIGAHALVAEDNELNRRIICAMLKREGVSAVEVPDGEAAVKRFVEFPEGTFDFILMDMRMPNVDGIRATEMIRSSGKKDAKTVPIIGVSANGFEDDINKARLAGISAYMTKPVDKDKLFETMRSMRKKK